MTGQTCYGGDLAGLDVLTAKVLRSPHPHARILAVDAAAARAVPGVVAVLTREGLRRMLSAEPDLAARFLLAMSSRLAERLRETTDKLKRFVQLTGMLQREVFMLMDARPATTQPPPDAALLPTRPAPLDEPRRRGGGRPGR